MVSALDGRWSVLAVDDESVCLRALRDTLLTTGCRVIPATSGREALAILEEREPDLVLLDLNLPDVDGYEVCRRIRGFSDVPVIILTALDGEAEKVKGLDIGADDYVTKPFLPGELAARVRANLRRAEHSEQPDAPLSPRQIRAGDLLIDDAKKQVLRNGVALNLSPIEYRLLWELASNAGRIISPSRLAERAWGRPEEEVVETLKSTIRRVRQRLGDDPAAPRYIATKRGFGYSFVASVRAA